MLETPVPVGPCPILAAAVIPTGSKVAPLALRKAVGVSAGPAANGARWPVLLNGVVRVRACRVVPKRSHGGEPFRGSEYHSQAAASFALGAL